MKSGLMLGVNPNAKREKNDFYATEPKSIKLALPYLISTGISKNLWENAVGMGHIADVLKASGFNVKCSDLVDRGYKDTEIINFLECTEKWNGDIITNPPFKLAEKFVEKGFELINEGNKLYYFLKVQFLEGINRNEMYKKYPLKHLLVYSARQKCAKDAEFEKYTATTQCYCWFVFEKGYNGKPDIEWIL